MPKQKAKVIRKKIQKPKGPNPFAAKRAAQIIKKRKSEQEKIFKELGF